MNIFPLESKNNFKLAANQLTMAYTLIPTESKSKIDRAGYYLALDPDINTHEDMIKFLDSINLANQWRACHAYPLNTFQATLRTKLKSFNGSPLVAQRLKRMPTIIDKLTRFPRMRLTQLQDIAGVRAILENIDDVNLLVSKYVNNPNFPHIHVEPIYDYINYPRNEDGYRSVHLIYKYNNKKNPIYNGLKIEIQIRTKLQHIWATAVETVGSVIGQQLKSRQGEENWLNFFALVSSAFAIEEGTPKVPKYAELSKSETYKEIARLENEVGVLDKIKGFNVVVNFDHSSKAYSYHLIKIDKNTNKIDVIAYDRESYQKALSDYAEYESKTTTQYDVVLVSAGPVEALKKAYPNLFLDLSVFQKLLTNMISEGQIYIDFGDEIN